jgi:hypothetical protein
MAFFWCVCVCVCVRVYVLRVIFTFISYLFICAVCFFATECLFDM